MPQLLPTGSSGVSVQGTATRSGNSAIVAEPSVPPLFHLSVT